MGSGQAKTDDAPSLNTEITEEEEPKEATVSVSARLIETLQGQIYQEEIEASVPPEYRIL